MATNTYVALKTETLLATASSVTFTSIPQTYTDLVLVISPKTTLDGRDIRLQFNGDTGANYSTTVLSGWTSATSTGSSNANYIQIGNYIGTSSTLPSTTITYISNYSNTTANKTSLTRHNQFQTNVDPSYSETIAQTNLYRSTSAITSLTVSISSSTYAVGSTFSLYGIAAEGVSPAPKATGGAIYSDDLYYYHVFGSTGVFTPTTSITADVLVVAGGGGGGRIVAGGGGAGGLLAFASQSLTATGYTCTVGAGGAGSTTSGYSSGATGGDSQFGALTLVKGGGAGGGISNGGGAGGSGGGGGGNGAGSTSAGGSPTSGQGNAGGTSTGNTIVYIGAGGGGAGAAGGVNTTLKAGDGGVGSSTYSSWGTATGVGQNVSGTYYLAGGGGGGWSSTPNQIQSVGLGGLGGGGYGGYSYAGTDVAGLAGTPNTGGGGGAAGNDVTGANVNSYGKNGGSGVVIVRYLKA
jgi:hypothetical protein